MANVSRRELMIGAAAIGIAGLVNPKLLRAQNGAINVGALVPLTGGGGAYGSLMADVARKVIEEANASGGILGRQVSLFVEDDQTNPEAGVRAARKLIDVDQVSAIFGLWNSAVTTAIAPLCWESKTLLATTGGADSITLLPHQGYIIRTNPTTTLLGKTFGQRAVEMGAKRISFLVPQSPYADSMYNALKAVVEAAGGQSLQVVYDDKKPTLRTEVDEALRFTPDFIVLAGFSPDTSILLRELYRAGYAGKSIGYGFSITNDVVAALPAEVTQGVYTINMAGSVTSPAFKAVSEMVKSDSPDIAICQTYDQITLILLAMEYANDTSGEAIKIGVRSVSQGNGPKVTSLTEGLKAIRSGSAVNYEGASGPCDFSDIGDVTGGVFRYERVDQGKIKLIEIK